MRRSILFFLVMASMSAFATGPDDTATTVQGYLLDVMCYNRLKPKDNLERAAALHARGCLQGPYCARSGYGVLTVDKRFIRFDQDGNEKVKKFIAGFTKETDIRVMVTGTVNGENMTITKIELQ
jgi:hypothetical protein